MNKSNQTSIKSPHKVCYLLLNIGVPSGKESHIDRNGKQTNMRFGMLKAVVQKSCKAAGVIPIFLEPKSKHSSFKHKRYGFRMPYFREDEETIIKVAETFIFCLSLFHPIIDLKHLDTIYKFPSEIIEDKASIDEDKLIDFDQSKPYHDRFFNHSRLLSITITTIFDHIRAWEYFPIVHNDDSLLRSVRYIAESLDNFYVPIGGIDGVIAKDPEYPNSNLERILIEDAILNSFRAVEAAIGGLPNKENKLKYKIKTKTGLDSSLSLGYVHQKPLSQYLREMETIRDKGIAHGSTPNRQISILETLNYQECARTIVNSSILNRLEHSIFDIA